MAMPCAAAAFESADGTTWDAVVVGAGPAGAMVARALALGDRRVLLVDRKPFPRWKICGACLNGQALASLRAVGLGSLVAQLGAIRLDEFRAGFNGRMVRLVLPEGVSLSRARLDAALVDAATQAGAVFLPETPALIGGIKNDVRIVRLTHRGRTTETAGRVVLAASGLGFVGCTEKAGGTTRIRAGSRIGAGCQLAEAPSFYRERTIFMAVGRAGYVGIVRVENGSWNVAAAFEPELVRRLGTPGAAASAIVAEAGFPPISGLDNAHWQGTAGLTRETQPLAQDRLFVIGDAAGYVEPFTGEGIAWALASAQAVAPLALEAIKQWDDRHARAWRDLHRRRIGRRQRLCRAVAATLKHPPMAAIAFEVLARAPTLASLVIRRLNAPPLFTNAS
jgi:flavin-dependent dehydrogenase